MSRRDASRARESASRLIAGRVIVRQADIDDLDAIVPLFDAYREFYGARASPELTRAFLTARQARGESVLFVAVDAAADDAEGAERSDSSHTVVGFTQLYPSFSSVSLRRVCVLNDLFVLPPWRRANVARRLVACGAEFAARDGAIRLELATQFANAPARRLYESLGFVPDLEFTHLSLSIPTSADRASVPAAVAARTTS